MPRPLPPEIAWRVVWMLLSDPFPTKQQVARRLMVSHAYVRKIWSRYKTFGDVVIDRRQGRRCRMPEEVKQAVKAVVDESASRFQDEIADIVFQRTAWRLSQPQTCRILRDLGYTRKQVKPRQLLSRVVALTRPHQRCVSFKSGSGKATKTSSFIGSKTCGARSCRGSLCSWMRRTRMTELSTGESTRMHGQPRRSAHAYRIDAFSVMCALRVQEVGILPKRRGGPGAVLQPW